MATKFVVTVKSSGGDYTSANNAFYMCGESGTIDLTAATTKVYSISAHSAEIPPNHASMTDTSTSATAHLIHCTENQVLLTNISGTINAGDTFWWDLDHSQTFTVSNTGDSAIVSVEEYIVGDDHCNITDEEFTTSEDNYVELVVPDSLRAKKWDATKPYLTTTASHAYVLSTTVKFMHIRGVQFYNSGVGSSEVASIGADGKTGCKWYFQNCIFRSDPSNTSVKSQLILWGEVGDSFTAYVWNCTFQDADGSTQGRGVRTYLAGSTTYVYNCTAYKCYMGFYAELGTAYWINCGAAGCTTGFLGGTQTTCSTSTPTFVSTSGTYDLHLDPSDNVWKNQGTDKTADETSVLQITYDIDGQKRPTGAGTWDIGADEVLSTRAPLPTFFRS